MKLRHIKYFIAVAEEQNVGRAAARLLISQPPLTRQIQQLEDELEVKLFDRTSRGMDLTEAGELFLVEARNILSVVERATERTQRAGQGKLGRLDVAIFGSGILDSIPKILLAFRKAHPNVKVVLHTMEKGEQITALRQRRISVGFNRMLTLSPNIASELVTTEDLFIAVNINNKLAEKKVIPISSLSNHPLIVFPSGTRPNFVDKVIGLCQEAGFVPQISQEVGDAITSIALVASDLGICFIPKSATTLSLPDVVYRPLSGLKKNASVDLSCIYRADDKSPIVSAFISTVKNYRKNNL